MAADDEQKPSDDDEPSPPPKKPDVRVGSHDDLGVHINRDLRAQGPSARGWSSNMSQLNFSSRGRPRDEIAATAPPAPQPPTPPPATPAPATGEAAEPQSPQDGGVLSWLSGFFSRR